MTTTYKVARARAGETTPWGIAATFCSTFGDGLWACVTHGVEQFADRTELAAHADSEGLHVIVWRCRQHGPEGGAG